MTVESGGDKDHLRYKFFHQGGKYFLSDQGKSRITAARRQGQVNNAPARLRCILQVTGAKGIYIFLLRGEECRPRFIQENRLCAVAMMGIKINDQHPLNPMLERMPGRDGYVIQQAKTHGSPRFSMVPGWTDDCKSTCSLFIQHLARTPERRAGCQEGIREGGGGDKSGRVIRDAGSLAASRLKTLQHLFRMDGSHCFPGCWLGRQESHPVRLGVPIPQELKPGGSLFMVGEVVFGR